MKTHVTEFTAYINHEYKQHDISEELSINQYFDNADMQSIYNDNIKKSKNTCYTHTLQKPTYSLPTLQYSV